MRIWALPYLIFLRLHHSALDDRRRDRTWRYLAWSVLAGASAAACLAAALFAALLFWSLGWWPLAIVVGALLALPALVPIVVRHALVPRGHVRAAYYLARTAYTHDSEAYAQCVAAWAHACAPTPAPADEAWLAARRDRRIPLGDAEVVSTALVAAARGDAVTARQLMRSALELAENHPAVRELAGEWLACDAVARGAWAELAADAAAARWPATPLALLLEGIAMQRCGAPAAPSELELRARWLLAPHRRATRALLIDPTPAPAPPVAAAATEPAPEPAAVARPPLPRAVAAHLGFGSAPSAAALAATVQAWDVALADDTTRAWLARRALELDAPLGAVDRAVRDVARAVTDELARIADGARLPAPAAHGAVGSALAHRLRHGRLDALEAAFARWGQRRHDQTAHAPIDEWREWVALRAAYDAAAAAGGLELRRLAFQHAYATASNMSAWLWNTRHEYALSHAISCWLRDEALAVGDTEAIELCTRNCQFAVPTRLGNVKA